MSLGEYFFPKVLKEDTSEGANQLRSTSIFLIVGHVICAILALTFVSIVTAFAQAIYIAILYSIYSALHTWLIWIYLIIVVFNGVTGIFGILGQEGMGFLFYAIIIGYYLMSARKLYYDSEAFRNGTAGGDIAGRIIEGGIKNVSKGIGQQIKKNQNNNTAAGNRSAPPRSQADHSQHSNYQVSNPDYRQDLEDNRPRQSRYVEDGPSK